MVYVLMWGMIGSLFIFWSALAWSLHWAAQWFANLTPAQLESATVAAGDATRQAIPLLGLPEGLTAGLPVSVVEAWQTLAQSALPWLQSLLALVPSLAGWLSPAIWIGWALGALLLLFVGIVLHGVIRVFWGLLTSRRTQSALSS